MLAIVSRGEKASVPFAQLNALSIILWTAVRTDPISGLPHARVRVRGSLPGVVLMPTVMGSVFKR